MATDTKTVPAYLLASIGRTAVVRRAGTGPAVGTRGVVSAFEIDARDRAIAILATDGGTVRVFARRCDIA